MFLSLNYDMLNFRIFSPKVAIFLADTVKLDADGSTFTLCGSGSTYTAVFFGIYKCKWH
jgi:hypothetical protein